MVRSYPSEITYSPIYPDGTYDYRHVTLTQHASKEAWELTHHGKRLLTDPQWRSLGVVQSRGWEHYEIHLREPHILLFRRLLGTDPITGKVPGKAAAQSTSIVHDTIGHACSASQAFDASGSLASTLPINAVSGALGSSLQHTCSASQACDCDASGSASQAHDASSSPASASSPIVKVKEEASDSEGLRASEPDQLRCNPARRRITGKTAMASVHGMGGQWPLQQQAAKKSLASTTDKKNEKKNQNKKKVKKNKKKRPLLPRTTWNKGMAKKGTYGPGNKYIRASRASSATKNKDTFEEQLQTMINRFPRLQDVRVLRALMEHAKTPATAAETGADSEEGGAASERPVQPSKRAMAVASPLTHQARPGMSPAARLAAARIFSTT